MTLLSVLLSYMLPILCGAIMGLRLFKLHNSTFALCLGACLGLGLTSILYLLLCLILGFNIWLLYGLELTLLVILVIKTNLTKLTLLKVPGENKAVNRFFFFIIISLLIIFVFFLLISLYHPYGRWDAWMIWNTKAIHLAKGGLGWYFNKSIYSLSHPGYPMLLPLLVAQGWEILETTTSIVPITVAMIFTLLTITIIWSYFYETKGPLFGLLAIAFMIITPQFILEGTSQYADIPLACFTIGTVTLIRFNNEKLNLNSLYILIGVLMGMILSLKNEGALIVLTLVLSWFVMIWLKNWSLKGLFLALSVLTLFVGLHFYYKSNVPSQDHLQAIVWDFKLIDQAISNAPLILDYYVKNLIKVSEVLILILLIVFLKPFNLHLKIKGESLFTTIFILLTMAGFTVIYLVVSNPEFLLSSSSRRLLMQLYPCIVMVIVTNISSNRSIS